MLSPNRNNIYKHFFMASGCIIILSVILALTTQLSIRSMVTYGILPAALLAFVLGLLTMVTRPRRLEDGRKVAGNMVNHLLNAVAQSELGYLLTDPSSETIQIARVIEGSRVGRDLYKPLLDRIYKRVPACVLPRHYGTAKHPTLDWHLYDLCIIVAKEDLLLANRIKTKLLTQNDRLKIYIDEVDAEAVFVPAQPAIRKIFYASSRICLALLSIYGVNDARRKAELNEAMQRAQLRDVPCQNYLMVAAIDQPGLESMKKDAFLSRYAEHTEVIHDQKRLSELLVQRLIKMLSIEEPVPPPPPTAGKKRFAIALSFTSEYRDHIERITEELKKRLPDNELVFLYTDKEQRARAGGSLTDWLKNIYRNEAELIVVFLCQEYEMKKWSQVEWGVVRELLDTKESESIMLATLDNASIKDLNEDIYRIDCEFSRPSEIADLIFSRLTDLRQSTDQRQPPAN